MNSSVGAAIVNSAGNTGNSDSSGTVDNMLLTNPSEVPAACQELGNLGLELWMVGLDWQVANGLAPGSTSVGC